MSKNRLRVASRQPISGRPSADASEPHLLPTAKENYADELRTALAFHEAGHAIMHRMLMGACLGGVTIVPVADLAGAAWGKDSEVNQLCGKRDTEDTKSACAVVAAITPELGESRIESGFGHWLALATAETIIAVAGPVAEEIAVGRYSSERAIFDTAKSIAFARSAAYANNDPAVVDQFVSYCRAEARALLLRFWPCVTEIARLLLERGTLDGAQIDHAIKEAREKAARLDREALREYQGRFSKR